MREIGPGEYGIQIHQLRVGPRAWVQEAFLYLQITLTRFIVTLKK